MATLVLRDAPMPMFMYEDRESVYEDRERERVCMRTHRERECVYEDTERERGYEGCGDIRAVDAVKS